MADDNVDARPEGDQGDALASPGGPTVHPESTPPQINKIDFESDSYNMNHPRRGKAVIFNNKTFSSKTGMGERTGTDSDATNLYFMFTEMGFDTDIQHDLKAHEMESYMVRVSKEDHSDADCFACAILSHGEEGYVYGQDARIEIEKLVVPFKGNRCKSLAAKPKLFFIQACRGTKLDGGVEVPDALGTQGKKEEEVEIRRIPTEADFLMAYSVVPGYFAWRNSSRGSWFVQSLVEVFRKNWTRMDLMTMMTRVCRNVAYEFESNATREYMNRKKQVPCITSMLTRDVYFTPKAK